MYFLVFTDVDTTGTVTKILLVSLSVSVLTRTEVEVTVAKSVTFLRRFWVNVDTLTEIDVRVLCFVLVADTVAVVISMSVTVVIEVNVEVFLGINDVIVATLTKVKVTLNFLGTVLVAVIV